MSVNKLKIFNDPIYGFITIPNALIFDLIEHKYFQRLRRITQMGLSYLVYPGAHHTRFHHALGCMHLMQKAIGILSFKGVEINTEEEEELAGSFQIQSIPTLMVFREKVVLLAQAGALPAASLEELIQKTRAIDMEQVHQKIAERRAAKQDQE